jgi:hypothetical protein
MFEVCTPSRLTATSLTSTKPPEPFQKKRKRRKIDAHNLEASEETLKHTGQASLSY